jgi:hypothetical protein
MLVQERLHKYLNVKSQVADLHHFRNLSLLLTMKNLFMLENQLMKALKSRCLTLTIRTITLCMQLQEKSVNQGQV